VSRGDPSRRFLRALSRELCWRPLTRRRLLKELAQHLDDSAADLQAAGLSRDRALWEAVSRLGDVETIVASVQAGPGGRWARRIRRLRSPAWVVVGAMSLVTAWAAELPQASGAKATTSSTAAGRAPLTRRPLAEPDGNRGSARRRQRDRS
jgi:hypothetical protein